MLTADFVSYFRETGPSKRGESGHAPGVGPNPSGTQQSIENLESKPCEAKDNNSFNLPSEFPTYAP